MQSRKQVNLILHLEASDRTLIIQNEKLENEVLATIINVGFKAENIS